MNGESTSVDPVRSNFTYDGQPLTLLRGRPLPLGATRAADGMNFALVCRPATAVTLVLADREGPGLQAEIPLDPRLHRTGDHWHVRIGGLPVEFAYGYRVDGPAGLGQRFDPSVVLLDPMARALSGGGPWGAPGRGVRRSLRTRSLAGLRDEQTPLPPRTPWEDTILYELHVRSYTADPSSGVSLPGTFAGLIEKIRHIKDLGVTAVELLPIHEFDECACGFVNPLTGEPNRNLWGYNTIVYGAPKAGYASEPGGSGPWRDFDRLVRSFHAVGIEVVLDVVFNHTAEGGEGGPTYHFRGLDNRLYYLLDEQGGYLNFSGCGNTVNSNSPVVRNLILTCLRNLVDEANVDGFRFDLASVLGRDRGGAILVEPPVVDEISTDSLLADTKLIAEPWDAAGLVQMGSFPGGARWSEWNGRYRDDVRRFWRGDPGMTSALATRLCGSSDLYPGRGPMHSINFVTCHDGFTLNDLVSYNAKHNEANGEGNRDGASDNASWNCGAEGPTDDPEILTLRGRQARNLLATLLVSQGVPMLLGGDEILRTQGGNNNAWCQDNATSWLDWSLAEENAGFLRFVREMIAFRLRHPVLRRRTFFRGGVDEPTPDIIWHGVEPCRPDFSAGSRTLAYALDGRRSDRPGVLDRDLYIAMNAYWEPLVFEVPASPSGRRWHLAVDTAKPSPGDVAEQDEGALVPVLHPYRVEGRSMIVLVSEA